LNLGYKAARLPTGAISALKDGADFSALRQDGPPLSFELAARPSFARG
jgi:hypothetical protein